jgi:hypothetical protein
MSHKKCNESQGSKVSHKKQVSHANESLRSKYESGDKSSRNESYELGSVYVHCLSGRLLLPGYLSCVCLPSIREAAKLSCVYASF